MRAEWYFDHNGKVVGPVSYEALEAHLKNNRQTPTLVWIDGMPSWIDARSMTEFSDLYDVTSPRARQRNAVPRTLSMRNLRILTDRLLRWALGAGVSGRPSNKPHAWRRFFARLLDLAIISTPYECLLAIGVPNFYFGDDARAWSFVSPIIAAALLVYLEVALTRRYATTLGKALYGIKIKPRIGWYDASRRAEMAWWRGFGIGVLPLLPFTAAAAYFALQRHGRTAWDKAASCTIEHTVLSGKRWLFITVVWVALAWPVLLLIQRSSSLSFP